LLAGISALTASRLSRKRPSPRTSKLRHLRLRLSLAAGQSFL
jgi:hypothetical protein